MRSRLKWKPKRNRKVYEKPVDPMKESLEFGHQMEQLGCKVVIHEKSGVVSVSPPSKESQICALNRSINS